jgi:(E)-4-hydroxy-3-methyl-but-2-enyl pyrophosphate reductase
LEVLLADKAGFCFGVKRAINMAQEAVASRKGKVYTYGPLIHNPQVVESLRKEGLEIVNDVEEIGRGVLIIRSHGIHPGLLSRIDTSKVEIIDATCPFVKKAQEKAKLLYEQGYSVVVVGQAEHPEVKAIVGYAGGEAVVINPNHVPPEVDLGSKVGVVAQTTQNIEDFKRVVSGLLVWTKELRIFNTICNATAETQKAALELAGRVDLMIVVGGKNSANTTRLAKLCSVYGHPCHHIETASELDPEWFRGVRRVGVTAGSSTPGWVIKEVLERLEAMGDPPQAGRQAITHEKVEPS